jgi:hypothetical protein
MKKQDTTPAVPPPQVTPNPGQIFEVPVETESETNAVADGSGENPDPAAGNA